MQTDKTEEAKANPALEQRVRSLAATFRNILLVVSLLFIFAVVRTIIVWAVCNTGMQAATAMQNQGLPVLNNLALFQENLALFCRRYVALASQHLSALGWARLVQAAADFELYDLLPELVAAAIKCNPTPDAQALVLLAY